MIVVVIVLAVFFVTLGSVKLFDALGGSAGLRMDTALFAAIFLAISIGCFSFAMGRVAAGSRRRRCPTCGASIRRRTALCRHCHRSVVATR